jgi:hypothetical protein
MGIVIVAGQVWREVDSGQRFVLIDHVLPSGDPMIRTCDIDGKSRDDRIRKAAYWRFALVSGARYGADYVLVRP